MFNQTTRPVNVITVILFITFLLPTTVVFAEETTDSEVTAYEQYSHALGIQIGAISGVGLSYQTWMNKIGLQVTGGIFPISIPFSEVYLIYDVGLEVQFRLIGTDFTKWLSGQLYLLTGITHIGAFYRQPSSFGWVWVEDKPDYDKYIPSIIVGIGFGIEVIIFRHISIPVGVGCGLIWTGREQALAQQFSIFLFPEVGLRYRF